MGGARVLNIHTTTWNPSRHHLSAELWSPSCARGASTPTCGIPSLYMWTPCRRYYICCYADRLQWSWRLLPWRPQGGDDCDRLLHLHRRATTLDCSFNSSSAAARLVVKRIYNPFTCKFHACNGRYSDNVANPLPFSSSFVRRANCSTIPSF
jgi:hypothetical protein